MWRRIHQDEPGEGEVTVCFLVAWLVSANRIPLSRSPGMRIHRTFSEVKRGGRRFLITCLLAPIAALMPTATLYTLLRTTSTVKQAEGVASPNGRGSGWLRKRVGLRFYSHSMRRKWKQNIKICYLNPSRRMYSISSARFSGESAAIRSDIWRSNFPNTSSSGFCESSTPRRKETR